MNLSIFAAGLALTNALPALNGATLTMYSGVMPATPETGLSGNTALAAFTFGSPAFGSPTFSNNLNVATGNFVATSVNGSATGSIGFARATVQASGAWAANTAYTYGIIVSQGGNLYYCCKAGTSAASGGPGTSVGNGIADNTCGWNYICSATNNVFADFTVAVGTGADILTGNLSVTQGSPVDISSYVIQMPCA